MNRWNGYGPTPDDIPSQPSTNYGQAADDYMDACHPESAEDIARWEEIKRQFSEKWIPLTNLRRRQAS